LGEGVELLRESNIKGISLADPGSEAKPTADKGVITAGGSDTEAFMRWFAEAIQQHRHWMRELKDEVPA
jgi:catalase